MCDSTRHPLLDTPRPRIPAYPSCSVYASLRASSGSSPGAGRPSRRLSRRYSHRSDWRFCFSMPASSSTRSACTRLMSALVRPASAWMSFDLAAAATFCSFARIWLVHRAWPLRPNCMLRSHVVGLLLAAALRSAVDLFSRTLPLFGCGPGFDDFTLPSCACFLLVLDRPVAFRFHVSIGLLPCLIRSCVELNRATERIATLGERIATLLQATSRRVRFPRPRPTIRMSARKQSRRRFRAHASDDALLDHLNGLAERVRTGNAEPRAGCG